MLKPRRLDESGHDSSATSPHLLQDLLSLFQAGNLSFDIGSRPPSTLIFTRDDLQLLGIETAHKCRGKESQRRLWSVDEVVIGGLHADAIHEPLPRYLVVRKEDVVEVLNNMFGVAHRMAAHHICKSYYLTMGAVLDRYPGHQSLHPFLTTGEGQQNSPEKSFDLPFFKIVVKVMVQGHGCAGALNIQQKVNLVDSLGVALEQAIRQN